MGLSGAPHGASPAGYFGEADGFDFHSGSGHAAGALGAGPDFGAVSQGVIVLDDSPGSDWMAAAKGSGKGGEPPPPPPPPQPTLTATYESGTPDTDTTDNFNIEVQFYGDWPVEFMDAFAAAAEFVSSIMSKGLKLAYSSNSFDPNTLIAVDDLVIEAYLPQIDGVDGILGQAGPTSIRLAGYTTTVGVMQFDAADAASLMVEGTWDDTVLHELFHVLGFGSLWSGYYPGIVDVTTEQVAGMGTRRTSDDVYVTTGEYTWAAGNAEYRAETGDTTGRIAVETDGGSGTALAHWDEATYGNELMTGYLGNSGTYLADWTIAALADLHYAVDPSVYQGADVHNPLADGVDLETLYGSFDYVWADPLLA